jgi:hypothetical protein
MTEPAVHLSIDRITRSTVEVTTSDYKVGDHYVVFADGEQTRLINHDDIREITVSKPAEDEQQQKVTA